MSRYDITISIVSYNSADVLGNCLDSIMQGSRKHTFEVIVVDNASLDGSCALVTEHYPQVTLINNAENVGFGRAHNQAFTISQGSLFVILNPDTIIFPGALDEMAAFMDNHTDAGAVGCKIWWDNEKTLLFPDLRIHNFLTALIHMTPFCRYFPNSGISRNYWRSAYKIWRTHEPIEVDGITGGIMMVRREVFESVGRFDEHFFLFFEEHDLQRRLQKAGRKIYYLPNIAIQHFFEESCRNSSLDIGRIFRDSALYYYKKHYPYTGHIFIALLMKITNVLHLFESKFPFLFSWTLKQYSTAFSNNNDRIVIEWPQCPGALEYIVEISYSPEFSDRAGMYIKGESLSLAGDILKRLPNQTGFLRVIPMHSGNEAGRVIKTIKIGNYSNGIN